MKTLSIIVLSFIVCSTCIAQTKFSLRADGTILKDNLPFFPMGYYIDRGTIASYKTMVDSLAASGTFNLVNLPLVYEGDAAWTSFLDYCAVKNIYVLTQLDYGANFTGPILTFKNHPAIYGWSVADDADNGYFTIAQLQERNKKIKEADPNHVSEISLTGYYAARRNDVDKYTPIADVSGLQLYPITPYPDYDVTASNALTQTYLRILNYVQSASKVNRPMLLTSQNYKWGSPAVNPRYPTALELRNMTYSGLAAGIKGIASYVLTPDLLKQTGLWNENKALRTDIATLETALLDGNLFRVSTGSTELVASYWTNNEGIYIAVVNTSYTVSKSLSLNVPPDFGGSLKSMFARMRNTCSFSGGKLSGEIAPKEVEVYFLKNLNPDFESPSVPTGLKSSSVTRESFTLSWTPSTDNSGVKLYEIFKDGNFWKSTAGTSLIVDGLTLNTAYSMTVRAVDLMRNTSGFNNPLIVKTTSCSDTEAPSSPANLLASSITHNSLTLSWTASKDNESVAGYEVFIDGIFFDASAVTKLNVTKLKCETSSVFSVKAFDVCGNFSVASNTVNLTTSACVYEVEDAILTGGVIQTDHIGYSGTGFWANVHKLGESALFTVNSEKGGNSAVTCRYSAGNGNQKMSLYVNDTKISQVSYPKTTNWDIWSDKIDTVILNKGSNTIKYQYDAADNGIINIDYISIVPAFATQLSGLNDSELLIYPNPSKSIFTLSNLPLNANISVFAVDGRMIESAKATTIKMEYDVSRWNKGIYLFRVQSENGVVIKKVIKE